MSFIFTSDGYINLDHVVKIERWKRGNNEYFKAILANGESSEFSIGFEKQVEMHDACVLPGNGTHILHLLCEPDATDDTFMWWTETIIGWLVIQDDIHEPVPITVSGVQFLKDNCLVEDKSTGKLFHTSNSAEFESREAFEKSWRAKQENTK